VAALPEQEQALRQVPEMPAASGAGLANAGVSGIERRVCDIRCNGCGRESEIRAKTIAAAREKVLKSGWQYYRKRNEGYDKCPRCQPPQGQGWRRAG